MARDRAQDRELLGYVSFCMREGVPVEKIKSTLRLKGLSDATAEILIQCPELQGEATGISLDLDSGLTASLRRSSCSPEAQALIQERITTQMLNLDQPLALEFPEPRTVAGPPSEPPLEHPRRQIRKDSSRRQPKQQGHGLVREFFFYLGVTLSVIFLVSKGIPHFY